MLLFTFFEMHTMTLTEFLSAKICYFLVNSFMWNLILWDDYWATSGWTIDILWLGFPPEANLFPGDFLASHLDSNWMLLYEMSVNQLEPFIQHFVKWTGEHIRKRRINLTWFRNVSLFYLIISVVFRRILSPSSPQDCTSIKPFFWDSHLTENASFLNEKLKMWHLWYLIW